MEDSGSTDPILSLDNVETSKVKRDELGRIFPGQRSINPLGRPKGKTIKERVREWLEEHPEDMSDFVTHFVKRNRELAWQMIEGSPKAQAVVKLELPIPIADVSTDNSVQKNKGNALEDQSGAGGDFSLEDDLDPSVSHSQGAVR